MAKELGKEPSLKEWWYKTHTHNDYWSTPATEAVYEQYNALFNDKYKDVEPEKQPSFDATLWKMVLDGRDVGVHFGHKEALGGLDPHIHSPTFTRLPPLLENQHHRVLSTQLQSTSTANWCLCRSSYHKS